VSSTNSTKSVIDCKMKKDSTERKRKTTQLRTEGKLDSECDSVRRILVNFWCELGSEARG